MPKPSPTSDLFIARARSAGRYSFKPGALTVCVYAKTSDPGPFAVRLYRQDNCTVSRQAMDATTRADFSAEPKFTEAVAKGVNCRPVYF
jgi:hypothetical protein